MRSLTANAIFSAVTRGGAAVLASVMLAGAVAVPAQAETETMTVWEVDMRGRPPYQRTRVEVPVVDVAAMETAATETVTVWTVDRRGKPPYQRRREEVPVIDAASLEVSTDDDRGTDFRGRPPFRRH